jgi:beta-galactosidase
MKLRLLIMLFLSAYLPITLANLKPLAPRQGISLDGVWEIEQGGLDSPPASFTHTVPVPGLADLAKPAFAEVGKKSGLRQAFWYRKSFSAPGAVPDVAILKIHKARYGTKVWLNGQVVGEHLPCFTPAYLDVKPQLKGGGQPNELIIRVGADRESLPQDMPTGWDFEKYLYIPGIYDSVELILTGAPFINNLQLAPDIQNKTVRLVAEIIGGGQTEDFYFTAKVSPDGSSAVAGEAVVKASVTARKMTKVDVTIPIKNCRLWTPENPRLYEIKVSTIRDAAKTRFGMRTFAFDPATKRALLNGKPYYLRGSNITLYRFFEDAARGDLPWDRAWVRKLHQKIKTMRWNSLRYCIGFPPEFWYDIADEEGILIQDEFPIWLLGKAPENPKAEKIIPEYTEWMRERWNHPCVVIWDGQNESNTPETGKAIQAVRDLDLSKRPFDNGWAAPQSLTDCAESHPYLFIRAWSNQRPFRLKDMPGVSGKPNLNAEQSKLPVAVIINEYCWLWLTRDGNPTCLTDKVYEGHLGTNSTVAQRRLLHARYVAALTEFWRCHREAAGVLHFCSLGYSRPGDKPRPEGGATSDDFIDLRTLKFEPKFEEYVKEAFNPVGLMLDFWAEEAPPGAKQSLKVYVINDLYSSWRGSVRFGLIQEGKKRLLQTRKCEVAPLGREILSFEATLPTEPGAYTLFAELTDAQGKTIRSLRDFQVKPGPLLGRDQRQAASGLAQKPRRNP